IGPDAQDLTLAPYRQVALGAAHHRDDIARTVGRAEQHDRGAGEAAVDRDQVIAEIGDDLVGFRRPSTKQRPEQRDGGEAPDDWTPAAHVGSVEMKNGSGGRTVRSIASLVATARTRTASRKRSCSPRSRVPKRVPNCA